MSQKSSGPPATSIFFHPDAVEGEGRDLVGRRSAGQSFLKGYLQHVEGPEIRAVVDRQKSIKVFETAARALGETRPLHVSRLRSPAELDAAGSVFLPFPGYMDYAWLRHRHDVTACSFVGLTHTVSTRRVMKGFHRLLAEPVAPWDAIICTSRAVQSVVQCQMDAEVAFYTERFGAKQVPVPQLPIIPLGIETDAFTPLPGARERIRAAQNATEDSIVVMTMGRLSVVEKANPVPLMLALEQVAKSTGRDLHLWISGWTNREDEEALYRAAAEALCHKVTVRFIDGRDAGIRRNIWAGADIFTLPSDSIQETFGLVPVEAMAAGLPVVMPDWDGFRDTVRHGETGFLIPTRSAAPGTGGEIAARFADGRDGYLQYLTLVQSHVQIDVPSYAHALEQLVNDPELRHRMGAAAATHARKTMDWNAVMPQYFALAEQLQDMRLAAATNPKPTSPPAQPLQIDPFELYADYPSRAISPDDLVSIVGDGQAGQLALMDKLCSRDLYHRHLIPAEILRQLCDWLATHGPATIREIADATNQPLTRVAAAVLMLAKTDHLRMPAPEIKQQEEPAP